jgi:hypothetical protein
VGVLQFSNSSAGTATIRPLLPRQQHGRQRGDPNTGIIGFEGTSGCQRHHRQRRPIDLYHSTTTADATITNSGLFYYSSSSAGSSTIANTGARFSCRQHSQQRHHRQYQLHVLRWQQHGGQ